MTIGIRLAISLMPHTHNHSSKTKNTPLGVLFGARFIYLLVGTEYILILSISISCKNFHIWSHLRDLNPGPLPYHGSALPLS